MSGAAESLVHEGLSQALLAAKPPELVDFSVASVDAAAIADMDQQVRIELGSTLLDAGEAAKLAGGSVVQLDEQAHDPVNIYADGSLVARGEILVLEGRLCVRLTELAET